MKNLPTKQELLEVAKPIIVNLEATKTIDKKSQARRVIKLSTSYKLNGQGVDSGGTFGKNRGYVGIFEKPDNFEFVEAQWKVDDILWVREPSQVTNYSIYMGEFLVEYKSDKEEKIYDIPDRFLEKLPRWITECQGIPRGCIKEMARTFLRVTNIQAERLQDITVGKIRKEGCPTNIKRSTLILEWFENLWNKTAPKGYKWEDNPWVFVYEFEKVEYQK